MSCNRAFFLSRSGLHERHYTMADDEFAGAVADCTLEPESFTHEAHLRLAWILLRRYELAEAQHKLCVQIERFDRVNGDGRKFNRELTENAAWLINKFQEESNACTFLEFIRLNPCVVSDLRGLLADYSK